MGYTAPLGCSSGICKSLVAAAYDGGGKSGECSGEGDIVVVVIMCDRGGCIVGGIFLPPVDELETRGASTVRVDELM
jgi:hypothetical protein